MKIKRPISRQPIPEHATRVYKGGVMFEVWQWQQEMYDGSFKTFEKVKRDDTVNVMPITKDKRIIVTEQEQPGLEPFWGMPGGRVDSGEDILEAAERELLEESGYISKDFYLFDAVQPLEKVEWASYIFIARNCEEKQGLTLDSGEKLKLHFISFDEFIELVYSEKFRDFEIQQRFIKEKVKTGNNSKAIERLGKLFIK